MKLRELLSIGELKTSKLLTKEIGLENEVDSAMVLEAIDIEVWSKNNQLILTSFYAFSGLEMPALEEFFSKMKQIGVSGLVVKMDRFITMIPVWFIDLCFKYEIPLIKIAQEISYEKILLTIYEPLLNHQTHILRTYYEVRQRFTQLEKNNSSIEAIMEEFYQMIGHPCSLKLVDKQVEVSFGEQLSNCIVLSREPIANGEFTKNDYSLLTLYSQSTAQEQKAIEVSIFNSYSSNCLLLVYLDSPEIKETNLVIIENTIDVLQEKFNTERLLNKERYTRLNNLADAILQNTPANPLELDSLLSEANMRDYPDYQAIAFSTRSTTIQLVKERILIQLKSLKSHSIFFDQHSYSIVLFNFDEANGSITKQRIQKLLGQTIEKYPELAFSISNVKPKSAIKEILVECLDILRFNETFYSDAIVSLADIGIFRYFIQNEQLEEMDSFIPENLAALANNNYDLFETFYQFLRNNRNFNKTADEMFLHSKTIRYRLNKIERLLAIDFSNPLQLLNHEIGAYIIKMRRNAREKDPKIT
ncbi:transcriptional regulator [Enterococcus sp. JM4C]|uniref:PucR family transcriptional regulator n=1 Tax=Candidatus Enterococcus huntleyi TaxID=1857217 RepID=UPI00137B5A22|nr:PucR family transcriptional regulator [Enterococcus sp. JM4C]KAF1297803.1 transcriptional regulator [Enterococcus sp. JM4C]